MSIKSIVGWSPGLGNVENQVTALIANIQRLAAQIDEFTCLREKARSVIVTLRLMIVPIGKLQTELLWKFSKSQCRQISATKCRFRWNCSREPRSTLGCRKFCVSRRFPRIGGKSCTNAAAVGCKFRRCPAEPGVDGCVSERAQDIDHPLRPTSYLSLPKNITPLSESSRRISNILVPTVSRWQYLNIDPDSFAHYDNLPRSQLLSSFTFATFPNRPAQSLR
ncbi:hypothetical protein B0H19DRAFT_474321 [Mycena capillaripes]|nr:hypothetical protein B0H19DRAFT_474321 [Mycena capillaripes]